LNIQLSASDAERTKQGAEERDKSCRLTGAADGYEVAHIVPVSERVGVGWFDANTMAQYTPDGIGSIHNMSNAIVLRADVHRTFDARAWVIVPDGDAWVSYILKPGKNDPQLLRLYHNVRM
jgi:HNH endonuclease